MSVELAVREWIAVGPAAAIPRRRARVVRIGATRVALFRTGDDRYFAIEDRCPHRGGPLSEGIVHGCRVACPLHDWVIELETGRAVPPDEGTVAVYPVRVEDGTLLIGVPRE